MAIEGLPAISAPLPWQADLWQRIQQQLEQQQLPHALLLAGPEHTGKAQLALALARLLLCQQPRDGLNCGQCHACELSAGGSHGDLRWLQPEDKSRVIKIDQVRAVVEFATKTAGLGRRKVVVLTPADSMNMNAANALLKSLEEPAADTHLVLVCHRLHGVPATIRSRCQIIKLAMPDRATSLAWLGLLTESRAASEQLLDLAGGRPLRAQRLLLDASAEHLLQLRQVMQDVLSGAATVPQLTAALAQDSIDEVLAHLTGQLQQLVVQLDRERLASRRGRAAFMLMDEVLHLQRALGTGANPNRQMLVEALVAKYARELGEGGLGGTIQEQPGGSGQ